VRKPVLIFAQAVGILLALAMIYMAYGQESAILATAGVGFLAYWVWHLVVTLRGRARP